MGVIIGWVYQYMDEWPGEFNGLVLTVGIYYRWSSRVVVIDTFGQIVFIETM